MGLKYEDYVKSQEGNDDALDTEITQAAEQTEVRRNVPDSVVSRFDGKSIDDVLEAYANAERKISEQGDTIGKLRKTSDQLLELQLQAPNTPVGSTDDDPVDEPLTVDALYEDADGVLDRKVAKATKATREELGQELALLRAARTEAALTEQYPKWRADIQDPEFGEWVASSTYRQRLAAAGNSYDMDAATDLLDMWNDHKNRSQEAVATQTRERQLDAATLESSSPEGFEPEETFSRLDLMNKRIAAKRGNREAEDWLRAHSAAIHLAYREERVTD